MLGQAIYHSNFVWFCKGVEAKAKWLVGITGLALLREVAG